MRFPGVKLNLSKGLPLALALLALATFFWAWAGFLPSALVEEWYSRGAFPVVSRGIAPLAAVVGWSLMDVLLPGGVLVAGYLLYRRRPLPVAGLLALGYLFFFWTWGVNYHRVPVEEKLDYQPGRVSEEAVSALILEAAREINRTYRVGGPEVGSSHDRALASEADARIRSVVEAIDGIPSARWGRLLRSKTSHLLNPVFRASGVTGMFNPFGHEPLVTGGLLPAERPMVVLHEIAHVRGYADEGEANFVALLAAVHSGNPELRYSGWLSLWMYLGAEQSNRLLGPGPRADLVAIADRVRRSRIEWVSRTQGRTLDVFLRVNRVPGGIRSYARIVQLAVGTRHDWGRFETR